MIDIKVYHNQKIEFDREKDGRWIADIPSMPGVMAYGATKEEAENNVRTIAVMALSDQINDIIKNNKYDWRWHNSCVSDLVRYALISVIDGKNYEVAHIFNTASNNRWFWFTNLEGESFNSGDIGEISLEVALCKCEEVLKKKKVIRPFDTITR